MTVLLSALGVAVLVALLIAVPVVIVLRDLRAGRPDPAYREPGR